MKGNQGLYCPTLGHENCGVGAVVNLDGRKSNKVVSQALEIVENLEHRAGKDAEGKTGDGVAFCCRFPTAFLRRPARRKESRSVARGNMASACSSSPRTS